MSETTPADVAYCYHGCEVFRATAEATGESVMVLRLHVHESDAPDSPEDMKAVEVILPAMEGTDLLVALSTGLASISGGSRPPAVSIPIQWGSVN